MFSAEPLPNLVLAFGLDLGLDGVFRAGVDFGFGFCGKTSNCDWRIKSQSFWICPSATRFERLTWVLSKSASTAHPLTVSALRFFNLYAVTRHWRIAVLTPSNSPKFTLLLKWRWSISLVWCMWLFVGIGVAIRTGLEAVKLSQSCLRTHGVPAASHPEHAP